MPVHRQVEVHPARGIDGRFGQRIKGVKLAHFLVLGLMLGHDLKRDRIRIRFVTGLGAGLFHVGLALAHKSGMLPAEQVGAFDGPILLRQ